VRTISDEICPVYERRSVREVGEGLIRPGGLELTKKAIAVAELNPGALILDIGCGTGAALRYLVENCAFRAVGIDLSEVLLAEGRGLDPAATLVRASGMDLPFAGATVDAILAECSLSAMEDVEKALGECRRVLKQGCLLLLHDVYSRCPDSAAGLRGLPFKTCISGAVSREEWIERLETCGFAVTFWEDNSRALVEFTARLVFACGSLEKIWCGSGNTLKTERNREILTSISSSKPGYFLAVAKKTIRTE
jgi:ubiquinone/menaquinone biosynthesis C-methylase UbiE